jgi:diguanylate cyclase (GGDEF)-like protein
MSESLNNNKRCPHTRPNNPGEILVVEDSRIDTQMIEYSLNDKYTLHFVTDGIQALDFLCNKSIPDLILLDIVIPGLLDGYELCKKIKQEPHLRNIPIIFTTGKTSEDDEIKGLECGAVDYISKPISPPIIQARVKNHIEMKRSREQYESLSFHDALTGIANRRRFDDFLELTWENCQSKKSPLSMILLDIDFFKQYNDHYGHLAGDKALQRVAAGLTESIIRPTDLLARYGGEEFAIIIPHIGISGVRFLAKLIQHCIHDLGIPHEKSSVNSQLTVSMGGATIIPTSESSIETFIKAVDDQLYQAKDNGRNQLKDIDLR